MSRFDHNECVPWVPCTCFAPTTTFHPHQTVGISFLLQRETDPDSPGGLVLDDVGLGKTLQMLALIHVQSRHNQVTGPTLVICERQLIDVWLAEIKKHFGEDEQQRIKTIVFHTPKQRKLAQAMTDAEFNALDIVFTTYDIVRIDEAATSSFLQQHVFKRIIVDEVHRMRNRTTGYYPAIMHIEAPIRWGLSARPVMNRISDLFALMQFMRVRPFDTDDNSAMRLWTNQIVNRMELGRRSGITTLHGYLIPISICRTKEILNLPPLNINIVRLQHPPEELRFYRKFFAYTSRRVERMMERVRALQQEPRADAEDHRIQHLTCSVNTLILRLRQACCSPQLVFHTITRQESPASSPLQRCIERLDYLLEHTDEIDECGVCMAAQATVMALPCSHMVCAACWEHIAGKMCPYCRGSIVRLVQLSSDVCNRLKAAGNNDEELLTMEEAVGGLAQHACKVQWLLDHISTHVWEHKVVIASEFAKYLDVIEAALASHEIISHVPHVRIDGSVVGMHRSAIIERFQSDAPDSPRILLMTYATGGQGITLTAASLLYEMDVAYTAAMLHQCEGRLHRMGQLKPVHVFRPIMAHTIEEHMLRMVEQKRIVGESTNDLPDMTPDTPMPWADRVRLIMSLDELDPGYREEMEVV